MIQVGLPSAEDIEVLFKTQVNQRNYKKEMKKSANVMPGQKGLKQRIERFLIQWKLAKHQKR